ncbi:prenyltransferase/squalene oxidase repeat-containing protein [Streptomyces sp. NPDC019224]|uniref:prenyltransferase/squalene oxidase repeat-containing protein n=1 Tax=Streptomyces sp. NPDC019224 TaxID=3154484 RepID=UPI0033D47032
MPFTELGTHDGGARQGGADLWCTYAAVRTLAWLDARPQDAAATAESLRSRQNQDGGFAWQKGLPSDVWATYYCTQALRDLGEPVPRTEELTRWLDSTQQASGGFAMTPGQRPDAWATYYAARLLREVLDRPVPRPQALRDWLTGLQRSDGGLGWYPDAAESDVRACYYAAMAWRASFGEARHPWLHAGLTGWLQDRQTSDGGFVFDEESTATCLWATFRAVRALDAIGAAPAGPAECVAWIAGRRLADGSYTRWDDYPDADVWACFSAVGALQTLGADVPDRDGVVEFLHGCELPEGGFTYRRSDFAGDSLATAALLLTGRTGDSGAEQTDNGAEQTDGGAREAAVRWLHHAHLPYEGGVMYMPGRGAEVRCTLWAVSALARAGAPGLDAERLGGWLRRLQNQDGGFGYWHGRGSDLVSTVSALEILDQLGRGTADLDVRALEKFLDTCADPDGYRTSPAGAVTCAATAQGARARRLTGDHDGARAAAAHLENHASRLGGYSAAPRAIPDLVSTYQAVLALRSLGLPVDEAGLERFLAKVRLPAGDYGWSPLGRTSGGPLAAALGGLLAGAGPLPPLNL